MENKYKKNDLYIAELKYLEGKRVELDSLLSYVILEKKGNLYYNVFDMTEAYPVFERSRCYSNCTSDGIEFGTMLNYKYGSLEDGPCWIVNSKFPLENDEFSRTDLEDFIINDERFFKDRRDIAPSRIKNPLRLLKLLQRDVKDFENMNYYLQSKEVSKVKTF